MCVRTAVFHRLFVSCCYMYINCATVSMVNKYVYIADKRSNPELKLLPPPLKMLLHYFDDRVLALNKTI